MERLLDLLRPSPIPKESNKVYLQFDFLLTISQIFAFIVVILAGYYHEIADDGLKGGLGQAHCHGLLMAYALIILQGEALLAYRIFRHEARIMSKMVHTLMHVCTIALVIVAFVNIVQFKNKNHIEHMYSFHSWIGISLIGVYFVQFVFGFINFWLRSIGVGQSFLPSHKLVGLTIFTVSVAQSLIGSAQLTLLAHSQSNNGTTYESLTKPLFVINFTAVFTILYGISVVYLVGGSRWRRQKTPDEEK